MEEWIDVKKEGVPKDTACELKQNNGNTSIGCFLQTENSSGIIQLTENGDSYKWDGQTYLLMVTHWRYL